MDFLILHVDLDFISGTISTTDSSSIYKLKSSDNYDPDRFWLFFEIDQFNQRIKYKKKNKQKAYDKTPGFIGDLMLRDLGDETFLFKDQSLPLLELIEESGILREIKNQFQQISGIEQLKTLIVYSDNIQLINRIQINSFFEKKGFEICSSNISLSELFCYYLNKNNEKFAKTVFVIEAWNENLNFSFLKNENDIYEREINYFQSYPYMGKDPRKKIIIEYVVDKLSIETCFLKSKERKENEYKRQEKFAEDWLNRLALVDTLILQDVTLANCSKTKYTITIESLEIENRTQRYINDLLTKFRIYKNGIKFENDFVVILSGESLSNTVIKKRFIEEFGPENIKIIDFSTLKNVYQIYPEIWQIIEVKNKEKEISKKYDSFINIAESSYNNQLFEKALVNYINAKNIINNPKVNERINEIEIIIKNKNIQNKEFEKLIVQSDLYNKNNRLSESRLFLVKALEIYAENENVISKLKDIDIKISIQNQKIIDLLRDANLEFNAKKWTKAKVLYEEILKIQPENKISKNNLDNCVHFIAIEPIIKSADAFFEKKEYKEAQNEYWISKEDSYCLKRYNDCTNILNNQRRIKNLLVEGKSLATSNKKEKLLIRYEELKKLINEIKLADSTNNQNDTDIKYYVELIESVKICDAKQENVAAESKNTNVTPVKTQSINRQEVIKSLKNENVNSDLNKSNDIIPIEKDAEQLFLSGRFYESKNLYENLPKSDFVIERIKKCIELRNYEKQLKAFISESNLLISKSDINKANLRLIELKNIEKVYLSLGINDLKIKELSYLYEKIK